MIKLVVAKGLVDKSKPQFYLTELETYEGFEKVIQEVLKNGTSLLSQVDGIFSRTALFDINGKKFKVIYHDDIGVYAFAETDIESKSWLQELLVNVVNGLNGSE